jgi:hypothetical protein
MHPSKAHQSTTKEPDSGLRLGFTDIKMPGNNQPSEVHQQTPSKTGVSTPTFDFRFARPGPQLGPEAQRMMDELREEALRIKAKLAAEREEEQRNGGEESSSGIGGRKIAQPKGKVGRFSDVHTVEFKKMDSIAGHASSFRAQPSRFTPLKLRLKRSQSKAKLDDREDAKSQPSSAKSTHAEWLENAAPAKRARIDIADDTSSARPVSRNNEKPQPSTPTASRQQSSVLASITTQTQASLARASSLKRPATQIPTLSRSPLRPNLVSTLQGPPKSTTTSNLSAFPKSESNIFMRSPSKMDRVKSILRHPSFCAKKPSTKPSAIPSFARSPSKPNFDKALPSVPTTPGGLGGSKSVKHVNFTPDTKDQRAPAVQNSPSPMKSAIPRSASRFNFSAKASSSNLSSGVKSKTLEVQYPAIADHPSLKQPEEIEYPSLASGRPLPEPPRQSASQPQLPPSVPGTFTFRSDHTINFGASPTGFGASPGQSSVRQVRPSIFPGSMPGSFPVGNKENVAPLPSVPHGMSNRKRRRVDSDDEKEEEEDHSPKKRKAEAAEGQMLMAPRIEVEKIALKSRIPSPAKKKGLSLSRLNMLARPKTRK